MTPRTGAAFPPAWGSSQGPRVQPEMDTLWALVTPSRLRLTNPGDPHLQTSYCVREPIFMTASTSSIRFCYLQPKAPTRHIFHQGKHHMNHAVFRGSQTNLITQRQRRSSG